MMDWVYALCNEDGVRARHMPEAFELHLQALLALLAPFPSKFRAALASPAAPLP